MTTSLEHRITRLEDIEAFEALQLRHVTPGISRKAG